MDSMNDGDDFWRWLRTIEQTRSLAALADIQRVLEQRPASTDQRDLLAVCGLQRRRLEQQPAASVAVADPPTGEWQATELSTVLAAPNRSDETLADTIGGSTMAVRVLRMAIHQFHVFGGDREAESRLPPTVRAYLDANRDARVCPQCGAAF